MRRKTSPYFVTHINTQAIIKSHLLIFQSKIIAKSKKGEFNEIGEATIIVVKKSNLAAAALPLHTKKTITHYMMEHPTIDKVALIQSFRIYDEYDGTGIGEDAIHEILRFINLMAIADIILEPVPSDIRWTKQKVIRFYEQFDFIYHTTQSYMYYQTPAQENPSFTEESLVLLG